MRSGTDNLQAYAKTQSDSKNVVNAIGDCYIRMWRRMGGNHCLLSLTSFSGGSNSKTHRVGVGDGGRTLLRGMRGTTVGVNQFVFEAIANPVTRGDFRSAKGREFFVDVFGKLNNQEIGELLARMWSRAESNDKVVGDIMA
jgi:hypothetical protein